MSNMNNICCKCASNDKVEKFLSKLKGSSLKDDKYLCDNCYEIEDKQEMDLIISQFKKGTNINNLVSINFVKDFINPNSNTCIFKPIQKYTIIQDEDTNIKYIKIEFEEYMKFLQLMVLSNTKLHSEEWLNKEKAKQEKHDAVEYRKLLKLETDEKRFQENLKIKENKARDEIRQREYEREREKKRLQEHKEDWKRVYSQDKTLKPFKCGFCDEYKVFPTKFRDENDKPILLPHKKNGRRQYALGCIDCFEAKLERENNKRLDNTFYCDICEKYVIDYSIDSVKYHPKTKLHKLNLNKFDFNLYTKKELENICSNTLNEDGTTYLISNYTKMKKSELIEKMNAVKDQLIFDKKRTKYD